MRGTLSCQRRFRISGPGGFTFLELFLATFLLSIAAVGFGGVLRAGLRLWQRWEKEMKLYQEARVVLDLIDREFHNAMDVPGVSWSAKEHAVAFATLQEADAELSPTPAPPRIVKVSYRLVPALGFLSDASSEIPPTVLSRREQRLAPEGPSVEKESMLTSSPTQMQWEYAFASNTPKGSLRWVKDWTRPGALPCGIRVHLTLYDAEAVPQTFTRTLFAPTRDLTP